MRARHCYVMDTYTYIAAIATVSTACCMRYLRCHYHLFVPNFLHLIRQLIPHFYMKYDVDSFRFLSPLSLSLSLIHRNRMHLISDRREKNHVKMLRVATFHFSDVIYAIAAACDRDVRTYAVRYVKMQLRLPVHFTPHSFCSIACASFGSVYASISHKFSTQFWLIMQCMDSRSIFVFTNDLPLRTQDKYAGRIECNATAFAAIKSYIDQTCHFNVARA